MNYIQEKCLEHSEEIVGFDINQKDLQMRGQCTKCLANEQKNKAMDIQDQINQIKQTKQILNEERTNLLQSTLENIHKLSESVEQLKNFYIQQIELIIVSIKKWTQSLQNIEDNLINKIQSKESNDYQSFVEFIQDEQDAQIQDQIDFKVEIHNLFLKLTETNLIKKCQSLLENQLTKPIFFENIEKNDYEDIEELNLLCEDHKKEIRFFNLCKESISQKLIGCLECSDGTINQYTSIQTAHKIWKQVKLKRQEKMNKNVDMLQKKVNCLKDYLQIIQKGYNSAIENAINKLNIINQNYSNKVNTTKNLINASWKTLPKEEIIKIAQDLSQINQQSIIQDSSLIEYNIQDNQINEIIKETVLYLQEWIGSQLNKINGFINNFQIDNDVKNQLKKCGNELEVQSIIDIIDLQQKKLIVLESQQQELELSIHLTKSKHLSIQLQQYSQIIQSKMNEQELKPFTYNLIQNNTIKQTEWCYAIAFNNDNSIVVAGCNKQIKVFEFRQEQLKETQILSEHSNDVYTLNFMKKSSQFLSGSADYSIILWQMNENNQWICKQKLNEHTSSIYCLILNNNEDIIISGSSDKSIKFWIKQNEWINSQTITDHTDSVYGLSMNDSQNKVISCGYDKLLLIIEQLQKDQQWNIIQKIQVEQYGRRICFINDNLFTFLPNSKEQMDVYEMNSTNISYSKTKEIMVKCGSEGNCFFPQQYIKQKCLIVSKNGFYVNLIRKQENGNFIIEQSIDFGTNNLYGLMSDNGEYLIIWNGKKKEIQIRKYQEK
ncbi:unnamed protein product [Paramecium sonneborni]|uniref:WD40-repeat-containing domain n=1 Tax=Paramecium sonneborni TaxID=65129 RepID=A0A8S1Q3K0_9CILI|nr:unnamed protein product [Paramecium sonneborni]